MKSQPSNRETAIRLGTGAMVAPGENGHSGDGRRANREESEFDEGLRAMDDFLLSFDQPKRAPLPPDEHHAPSPKVTAPPHMIRRAIQEFQSGSLDELLIHKLLSLDRNSAEFRQQYVELRVESLMRRKTTSAHAHQKHSTSDTTRKQEHNPPSPEGKSPWRVDNLKDLWQFFGPQLTVLIVLQVYCSYHLALFLAKRWMFDEKLPVYLAALIIVGISLLFSSLVLRNCRGRDFQDFTPRLLGIGVLITILALVSYLGPMFL